MDYAVADARKAALSSDGDPDAAEDAVKASLEGPDGGLSVLMDMMATGRIGAYGVAINEECPVFPLDASKRVAWNAAYFKRILAAAAAAATVSGHSHGLSFVLVAGIHTLLNTAAFESGMLDAAQSAGVAVLAAAPFNSGILARDRSSFDKASYSYKTADRATADRARALADVCDRYDVSLKAAALAFPLGHPAVVSVVVGAKSKDEWRDCVSLLRAAESIPLAFWADLRSAGLVAAGVPLPGDK
jgi:aryl-alcohol dehydrogenase-like predicted oxidoreductase